MFLFVCKLANYVSFRTKAVPRIQSTIVDKAQRESSCVYQEMMGIPTPRVRFTYLMRDVKTLTCCVPHSILLLAVVTFAAAITVDLGVCLSIEAIIHSETERVDSLLLIGMTGVMPRVQNRLVECFWRLSNALSLHFPKQFLGLLWHVCFLESDNDILVSSCNLRTDADQARFVKMPHAAQDGICADSIGGGDAVACRATFDYEVEQPYVGLDAAVFAVQIVADHNVQELHGVSDIAVSGVG